MNEQQLQQLGLNAITIAIVQRANDFFGVAGLEGNALFVNAAGRKIFGLGEERDVSDLTMLDFIAAVDHDVFMTEVVAASMQQEKVHRTVSVRHFVTSEVFLMDLSFFVIKDAEGNPTCFMAFGRDMRSSYEAQELLNSIQKNLNVGGWQLDVRTGHAIWSETVYELHKVPVGTSVDRLNAIQFYAEHERERIAGVLDRCIHSGQPYDEEFEFIDAEGGHHWIRTTGSPVYDDNGVIHKVRGTFQDITELKTLETANRETTVELEVFKSVIENSPDFIGIADNTTTPIYLNRAGRDLIGMPQTQDIRETSVAECYPERIRDDMMTEIHDTIARGEAYSGETRFRHLVTDEEIPVLDTHFAILDSRTGDPLGSATITRDIRHEVELRETLEEERAKLAQASKLASLGELAAGVAHEINNPLTVISGSARTLSRSRDNPAKVISAAEKIDRSVVRIASIVNGLRKFSRADEGLNLSQVDLAKLIPEAIELVQARARQNGHTMEFISAADSVMCRCDEIQVEQVLVNLLVNAVDANRTETGSWTRIELASDGTQVRILVQDSGRGIPNAVLAKIFDPFFTTKEVGSGTGLGLSISAGIVADHGGSLEYRLMDGHTTFVLAMPTAGPSS